MDSAEKKVSPNSVMNYFDPRLDESYRKELKATLAREDVVRTAARELTYYHKPKDERTRKRHTDLAEAAARFIERILHTAPPSPERTIAVQRVREAKMWASAAVAME